MYKHLAVNIHQYHCAGSAAVAKSTKEATVNNTIETNHEARMVCLGCAERTAQVATSDDS